MEAMHKLAEEARRKLEAFGVNEIYYQAGKNLTSYFKKPALQACDYDPSIITASVPLIKNENYQMLLQMAMMQGDKGKWAKSQLDGIHRTMKQMITVGVSLGVNVMTNQGRGAWGDVAQLAGLLSRLASYNLFTKKKMDIEKEPEKSKNAFFKSLDSFKEIGTGFIDTLENRSNKYLNSPYDFFNWLTLGITGDIPTAIYTGAKERADHMWDSKEKFADWLALGTLGMAKGAFNPEEAWSAEHWMNSLGMATILFGPVEGSLLSKGGLKPKFPETFGKDNLPNQGLEILGPNPVFTTPEGLKFKFNDIQTDSAILPKTPVQKHYLNEIDRIRKGLDEAKGAGNKGVSSTNFKNIDDFLNGIKKFDEVIDDYAKVYKERIESNKPWSWDDTIPGGDSLSSAQKRKIKELAVSKGHIPEIKINKVDGMRYGFADFAGAGVVEKTVILPERFWGLSDKEQFRWLDEQIGGTKKGMTWHHTEIPGKMELVPFGIHNITPHNGGRTAGMWADAPR
jgi:hypothetical protein